MNKINRTIMGRVDRHILETSDVLYSSDINTDPTDIDVSRKYAKFLREHPDINEDDITIEIEENDIAEDIYGNSGGSLKTMNIVKRRKETEAEYDDRVTVEEAKVVEAYTEKIKNLVGDFYHDFLGYGYSDGTKNICKEAVYNMIQEIAKEKLMIGYEG